MILFHFMMEARAEIKKTLGWTTDGGGSGMKFFKIILFNVEPRPA